jgi:ribonuclease R
VGEDTGLAFRLGDPVEVRLVEAIPTAGALRFELLSEGRSIGTKPRSGAGKGDKGRPQGDKGRPQGYKGKSHGRARGGSRKRR